LEEGFQVKVLDDFSYGSMDNLKSVEGSVEVHVVDVSKREQVKPLLKDVDVVFHLAALVDVPRSFLEPERYWRVNVEGTINILEEALERGFKVVYSSSSSVYGYQSTLPIPEDAELKPLTPYGETKLRAEEECWRYWRRGVRVVALRYFNVYGERQRAGVVSKFLRNALSKRPLTIEGDGLQVRDFVYVGDVVEANLKAYRSRRAEGMAINVGTGVGVSIRDLALTVKRACLSLGVKVEITYTKPREGDIPLSIADLRLASSLLDFKPRVKVLEWVTNRLVKELGQSDGGP